MQEIFKDIPNYEGLYKISNLGNIKSLGGTNGKIKLDRILKFKITKLGYNEISLHKNNISKFGLVHRLVCLTFLENPENKPQVNHINGIRDDNRLENLEWVTSSENIKHSFQVLGRESPMKGKLGKDSPNSKKINQYTKDGNFIKTWDGMLDIERKLGICYTSISVCCRGKQNRKTAGGFIWKYSTP